YRLHLQPSRTDPLLGQRGNAADSGGTLFKRPHPAGSVFFSGRLKGSSSSDTRIAYGQAHARAGEVAEEPVERFASQRPLESIARLFPLLRYRLYDMGDVRPSGAVHFKADFADTHPERFSRRRTRTGGIDRPRDLRESVSVRGRQASGDARH